MRFFLDNNLSPRLARGMREFGEDVVHLREFYAADAPDSAWIPDVGSRGWILITRDKRVRKNVAELTAIKTYKVGAFFLGGKDRSHWDLIQQVVRNWPRILELAGKTSAPFAFLVPPTGSTIGKVPL